MHNGGIASIRAASRGGVRNVLEELFGSAQLLADCERDLTKMLRARGIYFGSGLLPTYVYAFVSDADQAHRWASHAERFVQAAESVSQSLLSDNSFCGALNLRGDALELVRTDPGYKRSCVICRPDGIPHGNGMKFVELNSDSPAMMMFLDMVGECVLQLDAFASLRDQVQPPHTADKLLDTLLECYAEFGGATDKPTIAITDWEGQKTQFEHLRLAETFEARGCATVVCDPRSFRLTNGELRFGDQKVDLVYRRALASEIIDRRSEIEPLLRAYRDGKICMVNPLRSYVAGAKSVMSWPEFSASADLVPRTLLLDSKEQRDIVQASPAKWALKRSQGHGGNGVVLPEPQNASIWRDAIAASTREVWIAQEYLRVPRIAIPVLEGGSVVESQKFYNWNPFVFGGRFAGGLVRVSESPLINITLGGGLLATFTM